MSPADRFEGVYDAKIERKASETTQSFDCCGNYRRAGRFSRLGRFLDNLVVFSKLLLFVQPEQSEI